MKPILTLTLLGLPLLGLQFGCSPEKTPKLDPVAYAATISHRLAADLGKIRTEVESLAAFTAGLYQRQAEIIPTVDRSKYSFAPNGAFYKPANDGKAALWISGAVPITEDVQAVAFLTEPLDVELIRICREVPEVVQAYYNDKNSLNRIYPWMDTLTQYEPKMDIPSFNFYYLADAAHNPTRRGVWVADPYVDPAGRGWMISAIAPVYANDALAGVTGLDVTLDQILQNYIENAVAPLAVISAEGVIVAATEDVISLLEMPPLKDHKYLQSVKQDTFKPEQFNIKRSALRPVRAIADLLGRSSPSTLTLTLNQQPYRVNTAHLDGLEWTVAVFTPEKP